jgi:protease I
MGSQSNTDFLEIARRTGVEIGRQGSLLCWRGPHAGRRKPSGPLAGKTVGIPVASEFSDFQAYYLTLYLTELGARVEFLGAEWITWKNVRPTSATKGVQGMWGMSLDPIPVLGEDRQGYRSLQGAEPGAYDALVIPGGHSADILTTEPAALQLIEAVHSGGGVIAAIGAGSLPLLALELMRGRRATGNRVVSYLLKEVGEFRDEAVVQDDSIITARDTIDTPALVRTLGRAFDPGFVDEREGVLRGKRVLLIAGEDFEDIELVVPSLEFLHRGAALTLATYPAPLRARPPMIGVEVVSGSFGVSVPLQEVPEGLYALRRLDELSPAEFDVVAIPGAFNPWNMVVAGTPVEFLKAAAKAGKKIAPICHGPIPLAAANLVRGKTLTGTAACRPHVAIMGGSFDYSLAAVIDGDLISGREPSEVPEFIDAITAALL